MSVDADRTFALALEEYKALLSEVSERVKNEFTIMAASLTITSGSIAALGLIQSQRLLASLAIPLISIVFGALYFQQESAIAVAATYIRNQLRPFILTLLSETQAETVIPDWEAFRRKAIYRAPLPVRVFSIIPTFAAILPGFAVLAGVTSVVAFSTADKYLKGGEYTLLILDWVFFMGFIVFAAWSLLLYNGIVPDSRTTEGYTS